MSGAVEVRVPSEAAETFARTMTLAVHPDALYDASEASWILGFRGRRKSRTNRMYEIPAGELPHYRMGPRGGLVRWLGRDLLAYRSRKRVSR